MRPVKKPSQPAAASISATSCRRIRPRLVADADAVLVDNRFPEFVTAVCRAAQARKIPIVIDLDQATTADDPLLALGTHVVASAEALFAMARSNDYKTALKTLKRNLSGFVAITDGPKGIYWLEAGELRHMPAFEVDVVDSLGAGDAFHGGFTLALVEGHALPDILRFASATAALKCTKFGGASGRSGPRGSRGISQAERLRCLFFGRARCAAGRASACEIFRRYGATDRWAAKGGRPYGRDSQANNNDVDLRA